MKTADKILFDPEDDLNTSLKKAYYEGLPLFLLANISTRNSNLPFPLWVYSEGRSRNGEHNIPRIKVGFIFDGEVEEAEISITDPIEVIEGTVPKGSDKDMEKVFDFIKTHQKAFLLHYNMVWDDCAILTYARCVGRRKLSIKETLSYLLEDQIIDDITDEYQELFKED